MTDDSAQHDDLSAKLLDWLQAGENQPGGKLPLYDKDGERIPKALIQVSLEYGLVEPWTPGVAPLGICKLTSLGRKFLRTPIPQAAHRSDPGPREADDPRDAAPNANFVTAPDEPDLVDWVRDDIAEERWTAPNWDSEAWIAGEAETEATANNDPAEDTTNFFAPEPPAPDMIAPEADEAPAADIFYDGADLYGDGPDNDDLDAWDLALSGSDNALDGLDDVPLDDPEEEAQDDLEQVDDYPPVGIPTVRFQPKSPTSGDFSASRFKPGSGSVGPLPSDGMVLSSRHQDTGLAGTIIDQRDQQGRRETATRQRTQRLLVLSAIVTAISLVVIFLFLVELNRDGPKIAALAPEQTPLWSTAESAVEAVTPKAPTVGTSKLPSVSSPVDPTEKAKGLAGAKRTRLTSETLVIPFDPSSRQIIERIVPPAALGPAEPPALAAVNGKAPSVNDTVSVVELPATPKETAPDLQPSETIEPPELPGPGDAEAEASFTQTTSPEPQESRSDSSQITSDFLPNAVPLTKQSPDDADPMEAISPNPDPHLSERTSEWIGKPDTLADGQSLEASSNLERAPPALALAVLLPLAKPAPTLIANPAVQTVALPIVGPRPGRYRLQLLATGNRADAEARKDRIAERYGDLLNGTALFIEVIRRTAAPTLYRVKVGAFDSRERAQTLCLALRERGQDCLFLTSPRSN